MAIIGSLGGIPFSVSRKQVKTFDKMQRSSSARYAKHERHLKRTIMEFIGTDNETLSFSMVLSAYLGTNPGTELKKLRKAEQEGKTLPLVIGSKVYGRYRWVIVKLQEDLTHFDGKGNLLSARVSVSLEEYDRR